jgi:hypothetical protein
MTIKTYFMQSVNGGPIKIGRSADPEGRKRDLEIGRHDRLRILAVLDADREGELHERFASLRGQGEWFACGPELVEFLARECGVDALSLEPPVSANWWQAIVDRLRVLFPDATLFEGREAVETEVDRLHGTLDNGSACIMEEEEDESDVSDCECAACLMSEALDELGKLPISGALSSGSAFCLLMRRPPYFDPQELSELGHNFDGVCITLWVALYEPGRPDFELFMPGPGVMLDPATREMRKMGE